MRDLFNNFFDSPIQARQVGNVLVLSTGDKTAVEKDEPSTYEITGIVRDRQTGNALVKTSVYDIHSQQFTQTDTEGRFSLSLKEPKETPIVAIRNRDFIDTVMIIRGKSSHLDVELAPLPTLMKRSENPEITVEDKSVVQKLVNQDQQTLAENITKPLYTNFDIGIVPGLTSSRFYPGATSPTGSFNLFVGYNYGVQGIQFNGLLGIMRFGMKGAQVSGFSGITGGTVEGIALAGFTNTGLDTIRGAQVAGFVNTSKRSVMGGQIAGFGNIVTDTVQGVQSGGFFNYARHVQGAQLAGFSNISRQQTSGLQAAGFTNYSTKIKGAQMAGFVNSSATTVWTQFSGFFNQASTVHGAQMTGFLNIALKKVNGLQAAGFVNYATRINGAQIGLFNLSKKVNGLQLGLFNINDSINGVSLGLFNLSIRGFNRIMLELDHQGYHFLNWHTGSRWFHSRLSFGFDARHNLMGVGYGWGTNIPLGKHLAFDWGLEWRAYLSKQFNNLGIYYAYTTLSMEYLINQHFRVGAGTRFGYYGSEGRNDHRIPSFIDLNNTRREPGITTDLYPVTTGILTLQYIF